MFTIQDLHPEIIVEIANKFPEPVRSFMWINRAFRDILGSTRSRDKTYTDAERATGLYFGWDAELALRIFSQHGDLETALSGILSGIFDRRDATEFARVAILVESKIARVSMINHIPTPWCRYVEMLENSQTPRGVADLFMLEITKLRGKFVLNQIFMALITNKNRTVQHMLERPRECVEFITIIDGNRTSVSMGENTIHNFNNITSLVIWYVRSTIVDSEILDMLVKKLGQPEDYVRTEIYLYIPEGLYKVMRELSQTSHEITYYRQHTMREIAENIFKLVSSGVISSKDITPGWTHPNDPATSQWDVVFGHMVKLGWVD